MLTGILAGLAAGALWGLVFVAPRMVGGFASIDLTAGRFVVYGLVSVAVLAVSLRRARRPTLAQAWGSLWLSVLGFTGYYWILVLAIRDAGTEMPALIVGTIPIWVMLLGKPHGLRWRALLPGLALTALGLVLMSNAALSATASTPAGGAAITATGTYWRGIGLALVAMACWTAFTLLNAAWLHRHPEVGATDWANWLGVATGVGGLLLALTLGTPLPRLMAQPGWPLFALVAVAIGFGSSWLATILWNLASRRLPASLCGQLIVSETLFALLYSFLWDGRWPTLAQWLAALLFTAGILASIRAHR
ncbi:DMT family transporter [Ottowia sp.]|uniref:DMT family transporter n=1 Tax=Ottowia sp. TaxID=1898956 RepID=UPI002BD989A7|nr:DMT family transporter [Ottowia sp.]HRN77143.1 DMT family transporter [Ottowia sp.]HRQ03277.1 DMT family transporter [Ottowia sp.]